VGPVDGWGLAYFDGGDVRIYKEPEPAADSEWLHFIEGRRLPSQLVISHTRHATQGRVCLANTQPFVRELGGRMHVFAHNGHLPGVNAQHEKVRDHFAPIGDTDSEAAFCLLLERLVPLWRQGKVPALESRLKIIQDFAAQMRQLGPANFLYADGDALFAHGHRRTQADRTIAPPGLWRLQRQCGCDNDALLDSGIKIDVSSSPQRIVLFASVKLTDEPWQPLEEGEVIAVREGELLAA
jgi:glutamine amidotransferase